ncbi:hypothetical protein A5888_000350 [Enterococcus sp. 9E7_DIV0242]|uniref:Uncharacterized protein n=1 Tax=Candidatus Enterococcus clewellii TaxID=1834193 RepID=A0A242KBM5_9ENTE|nr:hypothetical protein A5888_000389 [Enterococcus sp. 9E7_DIV0242]
MIGFIILIAEQEYERTLTSLSRAEDRLFLMKSLEGWFSCCTDYVYEGKTLYSVRRLILEK